MHVLTSRSESFQIHSSIEGLVMKPCYDNNGAAFFAGMAAAVHNPLF